MQPRSSPHGDHDRLRLELMSAGRRLSEAAADAGAFRKAHEHLTTFCVSELLPHLEKDDEWLVDAGRTAERELLAQAIRAENRAMVAIIDELAAATSPCDTVAATRVLHTLLAAHAHNEELLVTAIGARSAPAGR